MPTLIGLGYVVPGADDFANAKIIENLRLEHTFLGAALSFDKKIYLTHQGTYFGCLLGGLMPSWRHSFFLLRLFLIIGAVLLVVSTSMLTYEICNSIFQINNRPAIFILMLIGEYTVLNTADYSETLTWFTGSCVYCYPLICFLFGAAFLVRWSNNKRRILVITSTIFALLGSGGSLMITGTGCWIYLLLTIVICLKELRGIKGIEETDGQNRRIKNVIIATFPFMGGFIGALINVIAPGNYIRHDIYVNELGFGETTLISALISSAKQVRFGFRQLWQGIYAFPIILALVFFVVLLSDTKLRMRFRSFFAVIFGMILMPIITCFPIFLGEGIQGLGEIRTIYIFQIALEFGQIYIIISLAAITKSILLRREEVVSRLSYCCIAFGFLVIILMSSWPHIREGMTGRMISDLRSGNIQLNTRTWDSIYQVLDSLEEQNELIVIQIPVGSMPNTCMYSSPIGDSSSWVNKCIANYYGHEGSFIVEMQ